MLIGIYEAGALHRNKPGGVGFRLRKSQERYWGKCERWRRWQGFAGWNVDQRSLRMIGISGGGGVKEGGEGTKVCCWRAAGEMRPPNCGLGNFRMNLPFWPPAKHFHMRLRWQTPQSPLLNRHRTFYNLQSLLTMSTSSTPISIIPSFER